MARISQPETSPPQERTYSGWKKKERIYSFLDFPNARLHNAAAVFAVPHSPFLLSLIESTAGTDDAPIPPGDREDARA
jgi:hypothetical protein